MCVSNFICLLPLFGKLKVSSSSKFLSLFGKVFLFLNASGLGVGLERRPQRLATLNYG
jgi:hypothetical protein